jgi:hypothetical protein
MSDSGKSSQLELLLTPEAFFQEKVSHAVQNLRIEMDNHVEFYLVNLLCNFIDPQKQLPPQTEGGFLDTPLALLLKQAAESPPQQRLRILKLIGDTSLYMSGFFQDYFNRKVFDIGYYIAIGSSAYNTASNIVREQHNDEHFYGIYRELAENFVKFVDVVAEVSDVPKENKPIDILAVYDRWARSNSARLRRILEQAGIQPVEVHMRIAQ